MPKPSFATLFTAVAACGLFVLTSSRSQSADAPKEEHCNYPPKSAADKDGWITLFNGKDLTGWKLSNNSKIHVEDGKIVCAGKASHAFTDWQF